MSPDHAIAWVEDNELVEVTPSAARPPNSYLDPHDRKRFERKIDADA